ncbi:MAG TPA: AMP-binding protein [Candidatus Dormibacteraeota bacterium]|nr:AMP-binding protein [Candidatus Dormibacteraeota bacterium]
MRNNLSRLQAYYDRAPSPARHVLISARGWLLTRIRYSAQAADFLRQLRRNETWTAAQIREYQLAALRRTLQCAQNTAPYYAHYPKIDLRSLDDLRRLPILTRDDALTNQENLLAQDVSPRERIRAGTTGTTGASLKVAYTEQLARENWAFLLRQWAWAGLSPRQPRITFQGARVVPAERREPSFWTYNLPERQILASIFHLSETTAEAYLGFLQRHRGKVLEGFPSVLGILADFALARGLQIPMRAVFTSGEPLYPSNRSKIEEAFGARVFDSYGMTEYCGLIQECEAGRMHLIPEHGFLEIVSDAGDPVALGEDGHFVWTGFLNRAMPLIRYRIGDRGRWEDAGPCLCGRAFPQVVPTITRESDLLRCPDGRIFSPRALNQFLKQSTSLRSCQFVHSRFDRVIVRASVASRTNESEWHTRATEELMHIRERVQQLLGAEMYVTAEIAAAPISRPGGKIPLIVNQLNQEPQ